MKTSVLFFLLIFCISISVSSKQNNYDLIFEKFLILHENYDYIHTYAHVSKINKTSYAFSGNTTIKREVTEKHDLVMDAQMYAFFSNEYRPMPFNIKRKLCDMFKFEFQYIVGVNNTGSHLADHCPIKPDVYWVNNYIMDSSILAPGIPWEKTMIEVRIYNATTKELVGRYQSYARLDYTKKYRRKLG